MVDMFENRVKLVGDAQGFLLIVIFVERHIAAGEITPYTPEGPRVPAR